MSKKQRSTRYIIVTGGVISGLGKGITAASLGACLKASGLKVGIQKFDMYLNVDAGTLKPGQHGEVFVTHDGAETDLDLGHYERFLDTQLSRENSVMQGAILREIIEKERAGGYLGDDVQLIPHVTDVILDKIITLGSNFDIHIVELGGTVGDYEGTAFVEAARQLSLRVGRENVLYIHVVYMPYLQTSREIKTKPAQSSIRLLRSIGITLDILVTRCETSVDHQYVKNKFHLLTSVPQSRVVILENSIVYQVPLILERQGIIQQIAEHWDLPKADLKIWRDINQRLQKSYSQKIRIGFVMKYLGNSDTYISLSEALKMTSWFAEVELELVHIDAEKLETLNESELNQELKAYDGFLMPGGFGERGVEGMIRVATYALKNDIPYLGICLGMQILVIAFARLHGLREANSQEFDPDGNQLVIVYLEGQEGLQQLGATMRLGSYKCLLKKGSLAHKIYGKQKISGRHRHRFEFNPVYQVQLEAAGLVVSGICPTNNLVEVVEISDYQYIIGCQFHPEFTVRPMTPQPLFLGFFEAAKS